MTALTEWFKPLRKKFYELLKRKSISYSPKQDNDSNIPEEWREAIKENDSLFWNEELQQPVSRAIKPGTYMEYLWKHPEEVRKILLEHGVDPDDDSMLGVINIDKKKDSPTKKDT